MSAFRSVQQVADFLGPGGVIRRLIGIAGSPGAGKSTIGAELVRRLDSAALLPMDGYHLPQTRLVELGRGDRMGAPDTFDVEALLLTLADLRISGGPVFAPDFDRTIEEPVPGTIAIQPEITTVVLEGNYLLLDSGGWERVAPLLDVTFFVELNDDIRRDRLIERHVRYGKSPEDARAWVLRSDEANARVVAATAGRADHRIRLK